MGETSVTLVEEGGTVVGTIVNAFSEMTGGLTDTIKTAFDKLILNEAGTGLSMFAIWTLVFMGVARAPGLFKTVMAAFNSHKKAKIDD